MNREIPPAISGYRSCFNCESKNPSLNAATKVVFFRGDINSRLMLIGRNPGRNEDSKGQPFIGKAGNKLDELFITAISLDTNFCYVCNLVKCFTFNNNEPSTSMILSCYEKYLSKEIEVKKPKMIIGFGNMVNDFLLKEMYKKWNYTVGELLEIEIDRNKCYYLPMRHPSFLCMGYGKKHIPHFIESLKRYREIIYNVLRLEME